MKPSRTAMTECATHRIEVPSPCTGVCRMDLASGYCEGCLRTIDEIAGWSTFTTRQKRAVLAVIARRRTGE